MAHVTNAPAVNPGEISRHRLVPECRINAAESEKVKPQTPSNGRNPTSTAGFSGMESEKLRFSPSG